MKRIIAALQGKVEKLKADRKVARVNRAIESARDNAQDEIDRLEEKKEKLISCLSDQTEVNGVIEGLSELIGKQEEQLAIIERLKKVDEYLGQDIEVEEKEA